MKNLKFMILALLGLWLSKASSQDNGPKVILITLDGFRWQELFSGADPLLVANPAFVKDTALLKERFWRETTQERREALMPFLWKNIANMGQLHGNRALGSKVDLANAQWFSYPGYNEILSGMADDARINSNDKVPNPNTTVLEAANNDPRFAGKVAAFGSWDVFPYIVNQERSGVPVNAGFMSALGSDLTEREKFLDQLQPMVPSPWGSVRFDAFTHHYAMEHMKKERPRMVYIAYGETDDFAHDGDYSAYLKSANATDAMIGELWQFSQQDPFYKDDTLFIITTDHGRGTEPIESWKSHGSKVKGAGSVWLAVFGKGVAPKGETTTPGQLYSTQIAPTIARALSLGMTNAQQYALAIELDK